MSAVSLQPETDYIIHRAHVTGISIRARPDGQPSTTPLDPEVYLSATIGDPNGQYDGDRGYVRFQIDDPGLWFKQTGRGDTFGWVPLDSGSLGPVIAAIQAELAAIQIVLISLQNQINANTAAITVLQGQVTVLQGQIAALQAAVGTLQAQIAAPFVTVGNTGLLTNERAINPTGALAGVDNGPNSTFNIIVNPNGIDNTLLADMPALSVKSNPTGALADPQDVATTAGTNAVYRELGGVLGWGTVAQVAIDTVIYEIDDFSVGQPAGEIASGPLVLTDVSRGIALTWEAQRAGATSLAIGATGLRYDSDATNTSFNSGSFTSSWIRLPLATLYNQFPAIDASWTISIECYFDLLTFISGFGGVGVVSWGLTGAPSNGAARMRGAGRGIRSLVQVGFGKTDGAEGSTYFTVPGNASNVLAAVMGVGNGVTAAMGIRASLAAG